MDVLYIITLIHGGNLVKRSLFILSWVWPLVKTTSLAFQVGNGTFYLCKSIKRIFIYRSPWIVSNRFIIYLWQRIWSTAKHQWIGIVKSLLLVNLIRKKIQRHLENDIHSFEGSYFKRTTQIQFDMQNMENNTPHIRNSLFMSAISCCKWILSRVDFHILSIIVCIQTN